ncbi:MAG: ribosome silencing factor [Nitrospinae bacterium RIFCSPLOWO2_12_FULL_47_7]|nr:MAG: ribosome silencing factor [Nitrospinae bacterium RIFCSPLOWO2_12_FULL_47_7]
MKKTFSKIQRLIIDAASEKKAFDILVLDLRKRSNIADCFVICSGNSKPQVQAIADSILDKVCGARHKPIATEGYSAGTWIVLDLVDVVVHVFQKDVRTHYDLERLWGDVPAIEAVGL